jgi:dCTP deaminase
VILSNTAIITALREERLVIDPEPSLPDFASGVRGTYDNTSVDLTLASRLLIPREGLASVIDPRIGDITKTLTTLSEPHDMDLEQGFRLDPRRFVLGVTEQQIYLPLPPAIPEQYRNHGCLAARVEGKSSLARLGLIIHFTAPTIHAGFGKAPIALEIMNLGPAPITLSPGLRICQLIVETVEGEPADQPGKFQRQQTAAG